MIQPFYNQCGPHGTQTLTLDPNMGETPKFSENFSCTFKYEVGGKPSSNHIHLQVLFGTIKKHFF